MIRRLLLGAALWTSCCLSQQAPPANVTSVTSTDAAAVLETAKDRLPKFYREFQSIKQHDPLIKDIRFERGARAGKGPGFAQPNGVITFDIDFWDRPVRGFDDNRLIVVLYHEIGHLHYFQTVPRADWTPDRSEQAAFEYSLLKTKELAIAGDCGPLATGVKFMKLRSEGDNLTDPHVKALKRMVTEPLYAEYVAYVQEHCPVAAAPGK